MDTGRVDPRVGLGRVGSKFMKCIFSVCLSIEVSSAIAPNFELCKNVSKYVANQYVNFYSASTS